ncbi:MAG: SDR family NAD(P)-dependent oxidoreductase, partial [Planctomycetota bacterium]
MSEHPVTIITGGSSGIGFATAQRLVAEQHRVLLVGRSKERLEGARDRLLANSPNAEIELHTCDMGDAVQASNVVGVAVDRFDRLDHLFNNAGVAPLAPIQDHTDGMIRETLYVNVLGPALAIADAWRQWQSQRDAGDTGRYTVINTSSVASIDPYPGFFAYGASK